MSRNYGNHGEVRANSGKLHKYLGMNFDIKGKMVKIRMENYVERIINEFPMKISNNYTALILYGNNLFENVNSKSMVKK